LGAEASTAPAAKSPASKPEPSDAPAAADEEQATLDAGQASELRSAVSLPLRVRSWPLIFVTAILVGYALHATREVLLPVFVAVLLQFVLGPAVRFLTRLRLAAPIAAAAVLLVVGAGASTVVYLSWAPAVGWLAEAPNSLQRVEEKLRALRRPVEQVSEVSRSVEEITSLDGGSELHILATPGQSFASTVWAQTRGFFINCLLAGALLYFLLASQDSFLTKLVTILPRLQDKKTAVEIVRTIERDVSRYLLTISSINVMLGGLVALTLWALGMPNPLLWGLVAGLFNFVPYLGTSLAVGIVAVVGLLSFDSVLWALLPATSILVLSSVESYFITPALLGRRFSLSPVVLFVWLLAWSSMWGIPGSLLAVPMLVIVHIVLDNIPALRPFAVFLKA
jgi:predicted PurR-regulated permease PerM